jgi:hypothetical protein
MHDVWLALFTFDSAVILKESLENHNDDAALHNGSAVYQSR